MLCCRYADQDQLQAIYSAYLQPVLSSSLKSHPVWGAVKNVHTLAGSMVAVYEQVSDQSLTFTPFTVPFTYKSSLAKKQLQFSGIKFWKAGKSLLCEIGHVPSCFQPHYESEASCIFVFQKLIHMQTKLILIAELIVCLTIESLSFWIATFRPLYCWPS